MWADLLYTSCQRKHQYEQQRSEHVVIRHCEAILRGSQDTYYVGTIKVVGRIYQQTFIDTYSKVGFAKLYPQKNALVAADLLNDKVLPWFEEQEIDLLRILTDRGTEYCGNLQHHEYQLYLALEDIDHSRTCARPSPKGSSSTPRASPRRRLSRSVSA